MPSKTSTHTSIIMSTKMGLPANAPESRQPRQRSSTTPAPLSAAEVDEQVVREYLLDVVEASSAGDPGAASSVTEQLARSAGAAAATTASQPDAPSGRNGAAQEPHWLNAAVSAPKVVRVLIPRNIHEVKKLYLDEKKNAITYVSVFGITYVAGPAYSPEFFVPHLFCAPQRRQECLPQYRHAVPPVTGPDGACRWASVNLDVRDLGLASLVPWPFSCLTCRDPHRACSKWGRHSIKSGHIGKDGMRQLAHALSNCTNLTFLKYAMASFCTCSASPVANARRSTLLLRDP